MAAQRRGRLVRVARFLGIVADDRPRTGSRAWWSAVLAVVVVTLGALWLARVAGLGG